MSESEEYVHLYIERGPETGREIVVPKDGARVGRDDAADIVIGDIAISTFHCRVFFKDDGTLCVCDLGSTNETLVNHKPIDEVRLHTGDRLEVGETVFLVVNDRLIEEESAPAAPAAASPVDLGFDRSKADDRSSGMKKLIGAAGLIALVLVFVALLKGIPGSEPAASASSDADGLMIIRYEKVQASNQNIFRYAVDIREGRLHVRVDNLADNKHLDRDKEVSEALLADLAKSLERTGFFSLDPIHEGLSSEVWDQWQMTLILGRRSHEVRVLNRDLPDAFERASTTIEEFAQNELGLAAVSLPTDKLLELATEAVQLGQKLFDEREVAYGNLYRSMKSFEEALWYLESVEPKPDNFALGVSGYEETRRMLQDGLDDLFFRADRAIRLREWEEASQLLQTVVETIPDRTDTQNEKARTKLLDVERRLRK